MREMSFTLEEETQIYLLSVLLGVALGLLYDLFRAVRVVFPHNKAFTAVEDVIYAALVCFSAFVFATGLTGKLRGFTVFGMFAGFTLEHFAVGNPVMLLLRKLVGVLKRRFIKPLGEIIHKIGQKTKVSFVKNHINLFKNKKNQQKPLKVDF